MPDVGGGGGVVLCMQVYGWLGVWLLLVIEPIRLHYYWPPQYHQSEQVGVRCHYDVTTMSQTNIGFRHQSKISQI